MRPRTTLVALVILVAACVGVSAVPVPVPAASAEPELLLERLERVGRRSLAASYRVPSAGRLEIEATYETPGPYGTEVFARALTAATDPGAEYVKLKRTVAGGKALRDRGRRLTILITARFTSAGRPSLTRTTEAVVREVRVRGEWRLSVVSYNP